MNSKKGVTGEIIMTFYATIAIVIILLIFIVFSSLFKSFGGISEGVQISKQELSYEPYNIFYLNSLLNCEGLFNGEKMRFYGVLGKWNDENTEQISAFLAESCKVYYLEAENLRDEKYFWCSSSGCFNNKAPTQYVKDSLEGKYLDFQASPYNVKLTVSRINFVEKRDEMIYSGVTV